MFKKSTLFLGCCVFISTIFGAEPNYSDIDDHIKVYELRLQAATNKKTSEQTFKLIQAINAIVSKEESAIRQFRIFWNDLRMATEDKVEAKQKVLNANCQQNQPSPVSLPEVLDGKMVKDLNRMLFNLLRENNRLRMEICSNISSYSLSKMLIEHTHIYEGAKPFPLLKF